MSPFDLSFARKLAYLLQFFILISGPAAFAADPFSRCEAALLQNGEFTFVGEGDPRLRKLRFSKSVRAIAKSTGVLNAVAAYEVDRQLLGGKARVPLTVERRIDDQSYSVQFWIRQAVLSPSPLGPYLLFLDMISDNTDRCPGHNLIRSPQYDCIAIDNELAFAHSGPVLLWADYNCRGLELSLKARGAELDPLRQCLPRHGTTASAIARIARQISQGELERVLAPLTDYQREAAVLRLELLQSL